MSEVAETTTETSGATDTGLETAATPDLSEQIAAINQRLDSVIPSQEADAGDDDLDIFDILGSEDDEVENFGEGQEPSPEDGSNDNEALEFIENIVRERVEDALNPALAAIEARDRRRELGQLAEEHPDLAKPEVQQAIRNALGPLAQDYGNDALLTDPRLVKTALLAYRAAEVAASEPDAEEARGQGASLETGVGAAASGTEAGFEESVKRAFTEGGTGGVFG